MAGDATAVSARFDPKTEQFTVYRHDARDPRSISHDEVWAIREDQAGTAMGWHLRTASISSTEPEGPSRLSRRRTACRQ